MLKVYTSRWRHKWGLDRYDAKLGNGQTKARFNQPLGNSPKSTAARRHNPQLYHAATIVGNIYFLNHRGPSGRNQWIRRFHRPKGIYTRVYSGGGRRMRPMIRNALRRYLCRRHIVLAIMDHTSPRKHKAKPGQAKTPVQVRTTPKTVISMAIIT